MRTKLSLRARLLLATVAGIAAGIARAITDPVLNMFIH